MEGKRRFFAWQNANPGQFKKALATAQKEGPSHVASHSGGSKILHRMRKKAASR